MTTPRLSHLDPSMRVLADLLGYTATVTATPLSDARDHLFEYVAEVQSTHNRLIITRDGQPAAVLISADELASLDETVDPLSMTGAMDDIRQADAEIGRGEYVTAAEMARILDERRADEHRST